jgi:anti-sigma B factor antagonist
MFDIRKDNDGIIYLSGRFDAAQADKAREVFNTVDDTTTVDFGKLEYISSAGIGVLLAVYKRLYTSGKNLRIINVNKNIKNVFHYAGLTKLFQFE